jgi:hypothetical protein
MNSSNVTSGNLGRAVDFAIEACASGLNQNSNNHALARDLTFALQALKLIREELNDGRQRPKGQRSAMFTRYVIDEEPQIVMSRELLNLVVKIENIYARMQNKKTNSEANS